MPAYTTHGWEIPGTDFIEETLPVKASECGGVKGCLQCRREVKTFTKTNILPELNFDELEFEDTEPKEQSEESAKYEEECVKALHYSDECISNNDSIYAQVYATQANAYATLAMLKL